LEAGIIDKLVKEKEAMTIQNNIVGQKMCFVYAIHARSYIYKCTYRWSWSTIGNTHQLVIKTTTLLLQRMYNITTCRWPNNQTIFTMSNQ